MRKLKYKYNLPISNAVVSLLVLEILFWSICFVSYQYLISNVVEFRFGHPARLWLLIIILFINVVWVVNRSWKNREIQNFLASKLYIMFLMDFLTSDLPLSFYYSEPQSDYSSLLQQILNMVKMKRQ